jgi:anthranilate phosphoribosyltransferase
MDFAKAILAAEFDPVRRPFFARVHEYFRRAASREGAGSGLVDQAIERLVAGGQLDDREARALFEQIIDGESSDDQIGALLVALRPDVLPAATIAAFARVMRERAPTVRPALRPGESLSDTCGTGSDTLGTFNVSTTVMFILAAAGLKIAKHGNRAITSRCGSADVLEALGVVIALDAPGVEACIDRVGIGFMFAPLFHGAFRNVQRIRRALADEMPPDLGQRSVFNVLGPLANPANAGRQIVGVYEEALVAKVADVLRLLRVERALVAYGYCDGRAAGLDEFSTAGPTRYAELRDGAISERELLPEQVGLARTVDPGVYAGGDAQRNARVLVDILEGREQGPRMDLALLNAGAGLYLGDKAPTIADGVRLARRLIADGLPRRKLEEFRRATHEWRP